MQVHIRRRKEPTDPAIVPTRFKQYVDRRTRKLNEIAPQGKVVAALNKCLAIQGQQDKSNYYIAGEELYCPKLQVNHRREGKKLVGSYLATGRCRVGRYISDQLSFTMMSFKLKFRDSSDEMGLPDLIIEEADMSDLGREAPLKG